MKKITTFFLALFFLLSFSSKAEGVTLTVELSAEKSLADCLNDYKTTAIPGFAYTGVSKLVISGPVEKKDFDAIRSLYGIESVDLRTSSLTDLPEFAFSEISGMTVAGIATLKEVWLPSSLVTIGNYAFSGCGALAGLNLEECDKLATLGVESLYGTAIRNFRFGKSLRKIDPTSLGNNVKTVAISVDPENANFESFNQALYNKQTKELVYYPFACPQKKLVVKEGTEKIGWEVFRLQAYLEEVEFPAGLKEIGMNAFPECKNLKRVNLPEGLQVLGEGAFGQTGLESVVLPASIDTITPGVFHRCIALKSVTINGAIQFIDMNAFAECSALEEIRFADLSNLKNIDMQVFMGCSNLKQIDWEQATQLKILGNKSFYQCTSLTSVALPNTIDSIGKNVFDGCESLNIAHFPTSLRGIGEYAFRDNKSLTRIEIGEYVQFIGTGAFSNCTGVKELVVEENNYFIKSDEGFLMNSDANRIILVPAFANIPTLAVMDGITAIDDYAFVGNNSLRSLSFPGDLEKIGAHAFTDCKNLERVNLSRCVKLSNIGKEAFLGCESLNEITWMADKDAPALFFNEGVFKNCVALKEVRLPKQTATVYNSLFEGCLALSKADLTTATNLKQLNNMFVGCESLAEVLLPQNGVLTAFGNSTFKGCKAFKSITIPASVKNTNALSGQTFEESGLETILVANGHPTLKSEQGILYSLDGKILYIYPTAKSGDVIIAPGVETIYGKSFYGVAGVTKVTLPASVKPFAYNCVKGAFVNLYDLKEWIVDANNPNYSVDNGVLYSKDFKTLYYYPAAKTGSFSLNPAVEMMESDAVSHNPYLTDVVVNAPLLKFLNYAFTNLPNLTSLDLPSTVTLMSYAVKNCPQLSKVIVRATTLPSATKATFVNCHPDLEVWVPEEAFSAYANNKYWSTFNLKPFTQTGVEVVEQAQPAEVRLGVNNGILSVLSSEPIAWTEIYTSSGALLTKTIQTEIDLNSGKGLPVIVVVRLQNGHAIVNKVVVY